MPDVLEQPGVKRGYFRMILNFFSGARAGGPEGHKLKLIVDKLAGIL